MKKSSLINQATDLNGLFAAITVVPRAPADLVVSIVENPGGVTIAVDGSLVDTGYPVTGWTSPPPGGNALLLNHRVTPNVSVSRIWSTGSGVTGNTILFGRGSTVTTFGDPVPVVDQGFLADAGFVFDIRAATHPNASDNVIVPSSLTFGTPLSLTSPVVSPTLADLGLVADLSWGYEFTDGSDSGTQSITFNTSAAAAAGVPEPSSLLYAALLCCGLIMRRRRSQFKVHTMTIP